MDAATVRQVADQAARAASSELRSLWQTLAPEPPAATSALVEAVPPVVDSYRDVAATFAADWYDEQRASASVAGRFAASLAPPAPVEQVTAMVRWAVTPIWQSLDWDAALRNLVAGSSRLVRDGSRDTIRVASLADPAARAYVRVARADACPFCLMLASRGAVYASSATASRTGSSGRSRGRQQAGEAFHDHCRCTPVPVFDGQIPEFNRTLAIEWEQVTKGLSGAAARKAWAEHFQLEPA